MTKIQRLKYYIETTKEKPIHSLSQQVEIWITLMRVARDRPKVLLQLGIRHDTIRANK